MKHKLAEWTTMIVASLLYTAAMTMAIATFALILYTAVS